MEDKEIEKRVFDESVELKDNAMLRYRKELFHEWDFEKNDELGLDVYKVTYGSGKKAWWKCPDCESEYDMRIVNRTPALTRKGSNCPYCNGKRVNYTNSIATLYPEVAKEWHPTLNGDLTPYDITPSSDRVIWWLGECGHQWCVVPTVRTNMGCNCPYCAPANARLLVGFNDMWTTNPELAKLLLNPEDGYKYMQRTTARLDWQCPKCDTVIRNKKADLIQSFGLACTGCSDGMRYPEKFMFHFLQQANVNFDVQKSFAWSEGRLYDFYLPEYNWVIETHGIQHYEENGFHTLNRSLLEEQGNDKRKRELASRNGIDMYIVIDARESTLSYIRKSIESSPLKKFVENVDFSVVGAKSEGSRAIEAWNLWNEGIHSTEKIAKMLKSTRPTIRRYLKRGYDIGKCDYTVKKARAVAATTGVPVVQLSLKGGFIKEWKSARMASKGVKIHESGITKTCKKSQKTAAGFRWMYKEDYYKEVK